MRQVEPGEAREQGGEPAGGGELRPGLAGPLLAVGVDHVGSLAPAVQHLANHLRGILEVGVDGHHGVATGVVQPGGHSCLVAEVPRKMKDADTGIARG